MKARSINKLLNRGDYFNVDTSSHEVPSRIVNLYNAQFTINNFYKLFLGWIEQQPQSDSEEEDDYIFVDRGGKSYNRISFDASFSYINLVNIQGEDYFFDVFPERINSFINFCEVAGIQLYWKKWVTEKYF